MSSSAPSDFMLSVHPSANSSQSSLGIHRAPRLETDKLDFLHNYDAVSETGHYSPVTSHAQGIPFVEYSQSSGGGCDNMGASQTATATSLAIGSGAASLMNSAGENGSRSDMDMGVPYSVDNQVQQQRQQRQQQPQPSPIPMSGSSYNEGGTYQMQPYTHSQQQVSPSEGNAQYGYY